jgi:hypothetical protein
MSLTHIYMTDPFPVTSIKSGGLKSVLWSQTFFFINYKSYKKQQPIKILILVDTIIKSDICFRLTYNLEE